MSSSLTIDPEFDAMIPRLADNEIKALTESILAEGCRDALCTWQGLIIDGHNRYRICTDNNIEFDTREMDFDSRDAVIDWMLRNQLGRRNLSKHSFKLLLGTLLERQKAGRGGDRKSKHQNDVLITHTSKAIADKYGVGSATVERAAQYVRNIDTIGETAGPEARAALVAGIHGVTDKDVAELAKDDEALECIHENIEAGCDPAEAVDNGMSGQHSKTDNDEYYTPREYIESARKAMGSIDTDPASNEDAQKWIQAGRYYTIDDSGLDVEWHGNVWINPPFSRVLIKEFSLKLVEQIEAGNITQAITLTNNGTDAKWFQRLAGRAAACCFPVDRIGFIKDGEPTTNNNKGQTFFYFGDDAEAFVAEFSQYGFAAEFVQYGD